MKLKNKIISTVTEELGNIIIDTADDNILRLEFEICSVDLLQWLSVQRDPVKIFW